MWQHRYDYLPTCEPFLTPELVTSPDYMDGFRYNGLKREVTDFVARCLTCQQVKAEHQLPSGLLQLIKIPLWKWERATMDFLSGLPLTPTKKDSVWIVVDRLAKSAHFISVRTNYSLQKLAELYISDILVSETKDKVRLIRDRLKVASDRQKSYANLKRHEIEYSVRGLRFSQGLTIEKGIELELPPVLDRIHDVFHISMLRHYRSDPTHIVLVEEIEVKSDLTFEEEPVQILDRDIKVLRRKSIPLVKVL
ncbi:uncharacterized protein LOC128043053 [Gossypium raimondii]|uniref:uncharacterized protein LOC128043053 n=1 Tax=Gossypium raimondii TaxID=29730 RepID=UPI00227AAE51|nr:uncharacterized protein LOC128043053 [Gossypium raimondii]